VRPAINIAAAAAAAAAVRAGMCWSTWSSSSCTMCRNPPPSASASWQAPMRTSPSSSQS